MRLRRLDDMRNRAAWKAAVPTPTTLTAITIANANDSINEGVAELFNLVVAAAGDTAYRRTALITTTAGAYAYTLPMDFHELKSVSLWLDTSGSDRIELTRFTLTERPYLLSSTPGFNGQPFKYMEAGKTSLGGADAGSIELLPPPSVGTKIELLYVFAPPLLVADADTLDGFAGFEDYAIVFAARSFAMQEENYDLSDRFAAEMERIKGNILGTMRSRDAAHAPRVAMTREQWSPRYGRRSGLR